MICLIKNKNKIMLIENNQLLISYKKKSLFIVVALLLSFLFIEGGAFAKDNNSSKSFPYNQKFKISAYYSPLKGQIKYVTGSYKGDIRLNGSGVNGADGSKVYPGMIAAPKGYPFHTKMLIPGVGTVAVHDRGGAIVHAGNRSNVYDRLDVWMGYGDEGRIRALKWGKRIVDVTVYGIDDSIKENVVFNSVKVPVNDLNQAKVVEKPLFAHQLVFGDKGEDVKKLQQILKDGEYYDGNVNGEFDFLTKASVAKVQIKFGIIKNDKEYGAGWVGHLTMNALQKVQKEFLVKNEIKIKSEEKVAVAHAASLIDSDLLFSTDLKLGDKGNEVKKLQDELKRIHLLGLNATGYYGEVTEHAVFKLQQIYKLVADKNSYGAGVFGPKTRAVLNKIITGRVDVAKKMKGDLS